MHLPQRYAQSALGGGESEFRLGQLDELAERVREKWAILGNAYNSADHHPVSHILPSEHVPPPPGEILGSARNAAVSRGVALEGKDRDLHHR
ncbi:hypothetical protein GCM10020358_76310 [Amorphoplanes nipponensis]|uniref:Uncharacterized protein n=1 Tax=Actinoplanes nipponensis TaxID=135950 RepID=A0A919JGF0_9ACTN|nr:hypothetical protein Ani05nite_35400 [Actinoplanes nipponensis]